MPPSPALPCSVMRSSCAAHERPDASTPVTSKRLGIWSPLPDCAVWLVISGGLCRGRGTNLITSAVGCRCVFQIVGQPECLSERLAICTRDHIGRAFIQPGRITAPGKSKSRPCHVETSDGQWLHTGNTHDEAGDRGVVIRVAVAARDTIGLDGCRFSGDLRARS